MVIFYENGSLHAKFAQNIQILLTVTQIVRDFQRLFMIHQELETHNNCIDHDTALREPENTPFAVFGKIGWSNVQLSFRIIQCSLLHCKI